MRALAGCFLDPCRGVFRLGLDRNPGGLCNFPEIGGRSTFARSPRIPGHQEDRKFCAYPIRSASTTRHDTEGGDTILKS